MKKELNGFKKLIDFEIDLCVQNTLPVTMAHSVEDEKAEAMNVWPKSLLLNAVYAETFSCIKYVDRLTVICTINYHGVRCHGVPKLCMNNEDGEIMCSQCAEDVENVSPSKAVQNMINKLKTRCLTIIDNRSIKDDEEGSNVSGVSATGNTEDDCDWTGTIKEWEDHSKMCPFLEVLCEECSAFKCRRKELLDHLDECPEVSIECPLSCGMGYI